MYRPEKYRKDEDDFIFSFIKKHPFATFVINGKRLLGTHIPILPLGKPGDFKLYSHIANHNEQQAFLKNGAEALIIFQGPNSYISSSWYKEKDISTWDYSAVHVNAKIVLQNRQELEYSLKKLVQRFEKDQEKPLFYEDIPSKILKEHLPQITGFWLEPFKVEGVAKLHQNYREEDVKTVVEKLGECEGGKALSEEIRKENKIDKNFES
ncbi:FMN-binding negative transcriptional regulator [Christiangramia fulva]|uniref:FMN-binding negative transcriptional regulator n=1 Tax=Christiangramia fulva TaxID=2126553 RepID=A0A2R3Z2J7_9FLAO|nr:FMN-binding negative transcriptional regulator [Christiangramia fulva]AVR44462.1 FMN-binding negative transcriptional regulator [Christiangramia fulva]